MTGGRVASEQDIQAQKQRQLVTQRMIIQEMNKRSSSAVNHFFMDKRQNYMDNSFGDDRLIDDIQLLAEVPHDMDVVDEEDQYEETEAHRESAVPSPTVEENGKLDEVADADGMAETARAEEVEQKEKAKGALDAAALKKQ